MSLFGICVHVCTVACACVCIQRLEECTLLCHSPAMYSFEARLTEPGACVFSARLEDSTPQRSSVSTHCRARQRYNQNIVGAGVWTLVLVRGQEVLLATEPSPWALDHCL